MAATFGLVVARQVVTSLVLDHFGLLGAPARPASGRRVTGALLIVAGVALVAMAK